MTCALTALVFGLLMSAYYSPKLSPDGAFYFDRPMLRPYSMRRPLSWLLGKRFGAWRAVSACSVTFAAFLVGERLGSPWATAMVFALPAFRAPFAFPVLPDGPGLACLALAFFTGRWELAAIGGLFCEKSPLFGAVLTSPWALVGLIPALWGFCAGERPTGEDPDWLRSPVRAALPRIGRVLDPKHAVLPWGGAIAGFAFLDVKGWTSVCIGYAQLLAAQDGARLYTWAALPVVAALPHSWLPFACTASWLMPWKDSV